MARIRAEVQALHLSLIVMAVLSGLALVLGLVLGIRVLVFDGAFGVISLATTAMALAASKKALQRPNRRNPFGWPAITPLVVAIQGVAALATLVVAGADAVIVITEGGQDVAVGVVAVYGVTAALVSAVVVTILRRTRTDLVRSEALQWRADAIRSAVIAAGAGVAVVLATLSVDAVLPYIDPVLVLISCVLVLPMPFALIRSGVGELLESAPPAEAGTLIERAVSAVTAEYSLEEPVVRAAKLGHRLYLEVIYHVEPGQWSIDQQDAVRRAILVRLGSVELEVWPSIELTTDPDFD